MKMNVRFLKILVFGALFSFSITAHAQNNFNILDELSSYPAFAFLKNNTFSKYQAGNLLDNLQASNFKNRLDKRKQLRDERKKRRLQKIKDRKASLKKKREKRASLQQKRNGLQKKRANLRKQRSEKRNLARNKRNKSSKN